jgi:hypothetical protein
MAAPSAPSDVVDKIGSAASTDTATLSDQPIMTPGDIESLFTRSRQPGQQLVPNAAQHEDEDDTEILSEGELSQRVETLRQVLSTLKRHLDSGSAELDAIAQKVGDGSRDGKLQMSDVTFEYLSLWQFCHYMVWLRFQTHL